MMIEECQEFHHRRLAGMYDICIHLQYNTLKKKLQKLTCTTLKMMRWKEDVPFNRTFGVGMLVLLVLGWFPIKAMFEIDLKFKAEKTKKRTTRTTYHDNLHAACGISSVHPLAASPPTEWRSGARAQALVLPPLSEPHRGFSGPVVQGCIRIWIALEFALEWPEFRGETVPPDRFKYGLMLRLVWLGLCMALSQTQMVESQELRHWSYSRTTYKSFCKLDISEVERDRKLWVLAIAGPPNTPGMPRASDFQQHGKSRHTTLRWSGPHNGAASCPHLCWLFPRTCCVTSVLQPWEGQDSSKVYSNVATLDIPYWNGRESCIV